MSVLTGRRSVYHVTGNKECQLILLGTGFSPEEIVESGTQNTTSKALWLQKCRENPVGSSYFILFTSPKVPLQALFSEVIGDNALG